MVEFLKELDSKTITLGLVLAAGLCWPVLHVTQIVPRNDKISELQDELSQVKGEIKALKSQSREDIKPYQQQLQLLIENKALIEARNTIIEKQLSQYHSAYERAVKEKSKLEKRADVFTVLRSLQAKKDELENSISFHQGGNNKDYLAQLERQSEQVQSRIINLQSSISSNTIRPTANAATD